MFVKRCLNNGGIGILLYAGHFEWGIIPSVALQTGFKNTFGTRGVNVP